jgi:hypothetical protein
MGQRGAEGLWEDLRVESGDFKEARNAERERKLTEG